MKITVENILNVIHLLQNLSETKFYQQTNFIIYNYIPASTYFDNARLNSIAIFYDKSDSDYIRALEHIFIKQHSPSLALSWFKVTSYGDLEEDIEKLVNMGCQGYITILEDVPFFINKKYLISQTSSQRIRDKIFMFLMEEHDDLTGLFRMDEMDCAQYFLFNVYILLINNIVIM